MKKKLTCYLMSVFFMHLSFAQNNPSTTAKINDLKSLGKKYELSADSLRQVVVSQSKLGVSTDETIPKEIKLYKLAIDAYSDAIKLAPKNVELYKLRGMVHAKYDQDGKQSLVMFNNTVLGAVADFGPESIADCDTAIELSPTDANAFFTRGEIYRMQFVNKLVLYRKAPLDNPMRNSIKPDVNLANKAIKDYKKAVELNSKFCEVYEKLASIYYEGFKFKQVYDNLLKAQSCGLPEDAKLLQYLKDVADNPSKYYDESKLNDFAMEL